MRYKPITMTNERRRSLKRISPRALPYRMDRMTAMTRRGFVKGAALAPLALMPVTTVAQQAAPGARFDVVVAGAGDNSLIAAACLARGGFRCLVLEGRPTIGIDSTGARFDFRHPASR